MFLLIVTKNVEKNIFQNDYVTEQLFFKVDYRNHLVMNKEHFLEIISKSCTNLLISILQKAKKIPFIVILTAAIST